MGKVLVQLIFPALWRKYIYICNMAQNNIFLIFHVHEVQWEASRRNWRWAVFFFLCWVWISSTELHPQPKFSALIWVGICMSTLVHIEASYFVEYVWSDRLNATDSLNSRLDEDEWVPIKDQETVQNREHGETQRRHETEANTRSFTWPHRVSWLGEENVAE